MDKKIKAAIVGYGLAGRVFHAPLLHATADLELKTISTKDPQKAEAIKAKYPDVEVVDDFKKILNDDELELVVIASPNEFHFVQAKEAILAGKNVVVDKPFTIESSQAQHLIELAKRERKMITAFQNRRWDGDFITLQKVIESGRLGNLVEAEMHYDRFRNYIKPNTWKEEARPGGGIIYDLGSHIIDQAQMLFGLPKAITAVLLSQREGAMAADNFELIMHYDQLKVTLKAGMLVRAKLPRYILLGDKGSFVKYGLDVQESQLNNGVLPFDNIYGKEPEHDWGILRTDVDGENFNEDIIPSEPGNYLAFYKNISAALAGSEQLIVTPQQAKNNIRIIEYALQSDKEQRTVPCIL